MKVKTIRAHLNSYGPEPRKVVGCTYDASEEDAENLIASGLVKEHKGKDVAA